ncbi:AraC family transcriptional regulator [Rhizobium sp. YJ-22]|uniref:helix-turn-helix transcriptional regulator n=1 Tax=Rhizobium sp. YJ-22 TaxID=3037556 RepID=UPI002412254D|nr:AraC family transcriptional regulator [Rhizobium sp. YJ-22]MDG3579430.1 AraC family transcriptional regulator [Rhizobium sp. YJ-22]
MTKPEIPQHLFVGAMEGPPTCTPDEDLYDVWPKCIVMVLLQGQQHFIMDDVHFRIDAGDAETAEPIVFMLNIARGCKLRFVNESQTPLRKVMISAPLPWIERLIHSQPTSMPKLRAFFCAHLAEFRFWPSRHLIQIAEQILNPPTSMAGELLTLHRNSLAFDILCQACSALVGSEQETAHHPSALSRRQSEKVRDYILAHVCEELTLDRIAEAVGIGTSSIQRHFKESFGIPISDFIRRERLETARAALERDGIPIAQAAYLAGYRNPSSFTTAFKKAYGVTPKHRRA